PPPAWRGGSGGEAQTTRGAGARGAAPFAGWLSTEHGKQSASRWDPAGAGPRPRLMAQAAAPSSPMRARQRRSNVAFTDGHVNWGLDSSRRASLPAIAAQSDAQRRASGGGAPSSTARGKKLAGNLEALVAGENPDRTRTVTTPHSLPEVENGRVAVQVWVEKLPADGVQKLKALGFELADT